jgi:WD40 repeat protein
MQLSGSATSFLVAGCATDNVVMQFRWSPDGQSFTYLLSDGDPNSVFGWHLVSGGVDREIGTAPRDCICGEFPEADRIALSFSPDGQLVSLVEALQMGTNLQVRRLDGSLVGTEIRGDRNATPVTMGVWSGTNLFFRDNQGVERWTNGTITPFLPGVAWLHPWASPDGGQIVYAVRGGDGLARVNVVDTASRLTRQLTNQPRNWPHFLTPRYVWYMGDRLCGPSDGPCGTATSTGTTYIYDLQTGAEYQSIITDIADVWPRGA